MNLHTKSLIYHERLDKKDLSIFLMEDEASVEFCWKKTIATLKSIYGMVIVWRRASALLGRWEAIPRGRPSACWTPVKKGQSINSDWSSLVGAPPRRRGLASVSATQAARHSEARVQTIVLGGVSRTRACSNTSPTCRRQ
ncbi:Urease subunit alpha [Trichinella spiralis]|uniref:Urease subunit alpha n=1 Tax=Trichinella spiralis TaxID=6334 RepID=A0ABR3KZY5_TRISP